MRDQPTPEQTPERIARVWWEYVGEELALFWESPYGNSKEKIATFWWPAHPAEATSDVERAYEAIASRASRAPSGKSLLDRAPKRIAEIRAKWAVVQQRNAPPASWDDVLYLLDQLDALTATLAHLTQQRDEIFTKWNEENDKRHDAEERAEQAEATLARVRALSQQWRDFAAFDAENGNMHGASATDTCADQLDAALVDPAVSSSTTTKT